MRARTLSTALWCSVMPRVQQSWARSARAQVCAISAMTSAGTPVTAAPRSRVQSSTDAAYSSKLHVARSMKRGLWSPAWMISRAIVLDRAMSVPTWIPNQVSAQRAELVRRGSTQYRRAPLRTPAMTWWKKMGWVSRAFEPQRMMTSVSSTSR